MYNKKRKSKKECNINNENIDKINNVLVSRGICLKQKKILRKYRCSWQKY